MTHDELLAKIDEIEIKTNNTALLLGVQTALLTQNKALRAVVELHKPTVNLDFPYQPECSGCKETYPCPTIQAIEKELS